MKVVVYDPCRPLGRNHTIPGRNTKHLVSALFSSAQREMYIVQIHTYLFNLLAQTDQLFNHLIGQLRVSNLLPIRTNNTRRWITQQALLAANFVSKSNRDGETYDTNQ